jgi:pantoate--beta-alanine ligase
MAKAFFMDVDIKVCPTIREASGLAFSSRNNRLNAEGKKQAEQFARIFHADKSGEDLHKALNDAAIDVEYLEMFQDRCYVAVTIGGIRLIDNKAVI